MRLNELGLELPNVRASANHKKTNSQHALKIEKSCHLILILYKMGNKYCIDRVDKSNQYFKSSSMDILHLNQLIEKGNDFFEN